MRSFGTRRAAAALCILLAVASAAPAWARPPRAQLVPLPFTAHGVSPDGSAVFGMGPTGAVVWQTGRIAPLAVDPEEVRHPFLLLASSRRARVVVELSAGVAEAVVWQRGRRRILAPDGEARHVSRNGRVVVGFVNHPVRSQVGMRWIDGVGEEIAADGLHALWPRAVSADGRTVLGEGFFGAGPYTRFVWRDGRAIEVEGLPHATDGIAPEYGFDSLLLSSDATTVAHFDAVGAPGCSEDCGRVSEAWRWHGGRIESLGWLRPQDRTAQPQGITGNGHVIVGFASTGLRSGNQAFLWDRAHGMRSLAELLEQLGADLQGFEIANAAAISDDGRRIVGVLRDRSQPNATLTYLAILPPACSDRIDNDGDGRVDFGDDRACLDRRDPRE